LSPAKHGDRRTRAAPAGQFTESTLEDGKARAAIFAARRSLDRVRQRVGGQLESAASHGTSVTTVLDEGYPLNLGRFFNLPPFLFYRGKLSANQDAVSVAVVGPRQASAEGLRRGEDGEEARRAWRHASGNGRRSRTLRRPTVAVPCIAKVRVQRTWWVVTSVLVAVLCTWSRCRARPPFFGKATCVQ
jgi:hypothetical protein